MKQTSTLKTPVTFNDTLRRVIESGHLEADLRRVVREELAHPS